MSYIVYARKWRPQNFDEILSQGHVITTLKNAISHDRVAHAYIFTGPRGIGKTSVARIFAKGLNCDKGPTVSPCNNCASCAGINSGTSMDVIEIDGASNNNVDQVRELRENIKFMPSYGRYKVYIVDEVHMLSAGAFNALLKTLEEPPGHAKFIFATTNPEKVPATVLSRCQRFDFGRIPLRMIISKLEKIAKAEKLDISGDAVLSIAKASDGSMRDAESILDQLASFSEKKINQENVVALLGIIEEERLADIVEKLAKRDTQGILKAIDELITAGKDISQFLAGLMGYLRNLMVLKVSSGLESMVDLPDSHIARLKGQTENFRMEELLYMFYVVSATVNAVKRSEVSRFIVEVSLIKLSMRAEMMSLAEIVEKVSQLESNMDKRAPFIAKGQDRESGVIHENTDVMPAGKSTAKGTTGVGPRGSIGGSDEQMAPVFRAVKQDSDINGNSKGGEGSEAQSAAIGENGRPHGHEEERNISGEKILPPKENIIGGESGTDKDKPAIKPDNAPPLTAEAVERLWPKVLEIIKGKKISVASYLLEGRLADVQGSVVTLGFANKFNFHREALERVNNKKFVEEIMTKVLGRQVYIDFITLKETAAPPEEPEEGRPETVLEFDEEFERETKTNSLNNPIIQSAVQIFGGRIIKGKGEEPAR